MKEAESEQSGLSFRDWLYLGEGRVGLIRRLTALCCLPSLLLVWNWSRGVGGPYIVPAWRFGDTFLAPPLPPAPFNAFIFILTAASCLWLFLGGKKKIFVLLPTLVLAYYCSVERVAFMCHFVVMIFIYMVALCFHHEKSRSATRRIIQLAVAGCYGFAVLGRLTSPTHLSGLSFKYAVGTGWAANHLFVDFYKYLGTIDWIWMPFSLLVIVLEIFLCLGFFFKKTRKIAFLLGVLLHVGIAITLTESLIIYSLIMITGYLAFFDGQEETEPQAKPPASLETALAVAFLVMMAAIPLRIYFYPGRPASTLCLTDKEPWTFHMFMLKQDTIDVTVRFKDEGGTWHKVPIKGRMQYTSADSDLYSMIAYLFRVHPEARAVEAKIKLKLNDWYQCKEASGERGGKIRIKVTNDWPSKRPQ